MRHASFFTLAAPTPFVLAVSLLCGCAGSKNTVSFPVDGMACANCANDIATHLTEVPGVRTASVNFKAKKATVTLDPQNPASMGVLQSAVEAWRTEHFGQAEDPNCLDPEARKKLQQK